MGQGQWPRDEPREWLRPRERSSHGIGQGRQMAKGGEVEGTGTRRGVVESWSEVVGDGQEMG